MKKRILAFLLSVTMILPLSACSKDLPQNGTTQISDTELNTIVEYDYAYAPNDFDTKDINPAAMDFAVRLFQTESNTIAYSSGDANRLISPFSVLTAMSMAANGAEGETLAQMEETFGVSVEELNSFISSYMNNLPQEEGNRFRMANSIWYTEDADFTVNDDFLNVSKAVYNADVYESLFNEETLNEINQWVEENTDGLIKEIINEIPEDAVMYLINALVFDAKWEEVYKESDIREGEFTIEEGIVQEIEIMFSEESLYLEDENATGFIKYYEGRDYAFVALLPKENMSVSDYVNTMSGEKLHTMLSNSEEALVHAWIPQFEVEYNVELSDVLAEMGMKDIFDGDKADLSGLGTSAEGNLFANCVLHKTYIEVSPVGTKAGAATAVEVELECALVEPEIIKEVRLDRPFVYMIIDCERNLPIFMGTVNYVNPYRCGIEDLCGYPLNE